MTAPPRKLSDHELSRVIDFLRKIRQPFDAGMPGARPDIYWNVVLELIDRYLQQRPVDLSTLIQLARASWGTGNRLVARMLEEGLIVRVPRGPHHKTTFLAPSERLIADFIDYATEIKAHLAKTFGLRSGTETDEYYFGGSYFAAHIIAPLQGGDISSAVLRNLRFLLHDDNYFVSMRNMWSDFRNDIGRKSSFDLRSLPELYEQATIALRDPATAYAVVALNMPWLGGFADAGLLAPLDEELAQAPINPLDFHPSVWGTGRWKGRQYGIPIYCTVEILTARRDLFEAADLAYPRTFDETIAAARALHRPEREQYGIAWNGARGMTIAHAFMFFMASSGGTLIEIPRKSENWLDGFDTANLRLRIDSAEGLAAIEYMRALAEVSPPGIATFDAERNLACFMAGHAAMSYVWTMRAARLEHEPSSKVKRRVAYLTPPVFKGGQVTAPVGGFLLTIPAYVPNERRQEILNAIAWMASPEAMKAHVKNGFPVAPRFSVCADPEALASSPIVSLVDRMARHHELNTWSRPPVLEYVEIERILGCEVFAAVFEGKPPKRALADAQAAAYRVIRARPAGVRPRPRDQASSPRPRTAA
ncbi:MAG: extracellular solute-binding protein [Acidibrevibacterium sp.]|jgi:multiple sugar transport system substrate-binding protein|uniref:extracellular solute-binding protein n=1 Tax=Acidibrevibacterium fodinaquatile TaxID=1969806 RepID=UPI0023A8B17C|nr:extracellular solute-binding protein [Acidibrevibacterium fodinaquatile]MCA7120731.1 extracellular solute-binding protein [Acidibrevibacterium fodinaquatile]